MTSIIEKNVARVCLEMIDNKVINRDEYFIYKYTLQVLCETVIAIAPILLICILVRKLVEMSIFITTFAILRKYTGGYHCKSFKSCFVLSFVSCLLLFPLSFVLKNHVSLLYLWVAVSYLIIVTIGSINTLTINWDPSEFVLAKIRSRMICSIVLLVFVTASVIVRTQVYSVSIGIGLIQTSTTMMLYKILAKGGGNYDRQTTRSGS